MVSGAVAAVAAVKSVTVVVGGGVAVAAAAVVQLLLPSLSLSLSLHGSSVTQSYVSAPICICQGLHTHHPMRHARSEKKSESFYSTAHVLTS